ncbi:MAG: hypothetical protein HY878_01635 [Deltaproteobacteria bacterium]|nr:hypothetical protein [Deltaproteobacteria bacterium]
MLVRDRVITQEVATNIINAEVQFHKGKTALTRKDYKTALEAFEWAVNPAP